MISWMYVVAMTIALKFAVVNSTVQVQQHAPNSIADTVT